MHKTKNAFTYLLLKQSVANDVINVSLFAYNEISIDYCVAAFLTLLLRTCGGPTHPTSIQSTIQSGL